MSRRFLLTGICLFLLSLMATPALAEDRRHLRFTDAGCSVDSAYGLRVDADGLRLDAQADDARPQRIGISDGALSVEGAPRAVSDADAGRLREIESGVRAMLPDIAAITREAIGITFDALGGVNMALAGNRRQARDFERLRTRSLARVDATLGRGEWSSDLFGDAFEAEIEEAAEAMAASFSPGRAVWMVMSGGIGRMERRMERMEAELERSFAEREVVMERHAVALCGGLERLEQLQDAMELRLDDGRPLRVFEVRRDAGGGG